MWTTEEGIIIGYDGEEKDALVTRIQHSFIPSLGTFLFGLIIPIRNPFFPSFLPKWKLEETTQKFRVLPLCLSNHRRVDILDPFVLADSFGRATLWIFRPQSGRDVIQHKSLQFFFSLFSNISIHIKL